MSILARRNGGALFIAKAASILSILPVLIYAFSSGPLPRYTGAPGDDPGACTACHSGTLNSGGGGVKIILPGANTYMPGVTQHIMVQVSDPAQKRWGFQMSARLASDRANGQAGDFTPTDGFTQVICDDGSRKPCKSATTVQFIEHTSAGTRNGTKGGVTFEFDWTPPSSNVGDIIFYAAGNAANGDGNLTGDHIYTTNMQISFDAGSSKPAINSANGVLNAASLQAGCTQNSFVAIKGSNLSANTRIWTASDIVDGVLPTSLDGISVMVNGKAAYVEYISPTQINVLTPADASTGPVQVQVSVNGQTSDPVTAQLQPFSPAFFLFDGKYLAAQHVDFSLIGKPGLFPSSPSLTTPAKPGETIILYGTGFGPTDPPPPAGQLLTTISNLNPLPVITIGGSLAKVDFGGLTPPYAGLYQFNVEVPSSVPDGDAAVIAQMGGVFSLSGDACCFITIQR